MPGSIRIEALESRVLLSDWSGIGGDAGMTKYTPDDIISNGTLTLDFVKRFYSAYNNDPSTAYFDASSLLIRDGTVAILGDDTPYPWSGDIWGKGQYLTFFNLSDGTTTAKTEYPNSTGGTHGIWMGENYAEIDSNHFSEAAVWNSDGIIYMRRGGDHFATAAYDPATQTWTTLAQLTQSPTPGYQSWGGDSAAFITAWQDQLVYRPGDTRDPTPYISADISSAAFTAGTAGSWVEDVGPFGIPNRSDGLAYGDIPKISPSGIAVVCGYQSVTTPQVVVQATNLVTGTPLWNAQYDCGTGQTGFYTSTSDYWRFIATDSEFIMTTGTSTKTLRVLNMANGSERWTYTLPAGDDPIMATHGNNLFVIGKSAQYDFNLTTGQVVWSQHTSFQTDLSYTLGFDVIYRPMVLTDDTMWFMNGGAGAANQDLVGIRTSDGQVITTIDLGAMVASKPGERLLDIRDIASADGKLAVLCDIGLTSDPNGFTYNGDAYQDVYVFSMQPSISVPADPSGLTATTVSSSQINLSWTDNSSNEVGFYLDRATDSGFSANLVTSTIAANMTTFSAMGLSPNTTYYFQVRAYNSGGASANSNPASATTLEVSPAAPSGLAASVISQTEIDLSWMDNSNNETGFYIDQASDSGFSSNLVTTTVGANVTTLNVTGLLANSTYYFQVRAYNGIGPSSNSTAASGTTLDYAPAAPSALTAAVISQTQIDLSWADNSGNEVGFYLDRASDSGFSANLVTSTIAANTTTFNVSGLSANSTYYFQVRAYNSGGPSANSAAASGTTLAIPPAAPSGLSVTVISQTQINLTWVDNSSNEDGFYIDQASDSGFSSNLVTSTIAANTTTFSAMGLSANSSYYFRVRAYDSGGPSANSTPASGTTLDYPPTAPSALTATVVSQTQINLTWTDNSSNETGFYLDRATDSGFGSNLVTSTIAANTTTFSAMGLLPNSTYYFQVRAYNSGGPSANTTPASGTTLDYPPAAPSGLMATAISQTQIDLTWTDNSSNETGFYIDQASDSGFGSNLVTSTVGANVTSFSAMGLSANSTCYFRVRAYDSGGPSANSAAASATTLDYPPTAPSSLSATVISQTQINLSWTDNSGNEMGFYIDRASDSGFGANLVTSTVSANVTSFSVTGLSAASTYYFQVRAYNSGGPSANSVPASATTLINPPAAPSGLAATAVSQTQINLTWVDNSSDETGFYIDRASDSGFSTNLTTSLAGANVTSFSVSGLSASSVYYFRVRAYNSGGSSADSDTISATTLPNAPSGLTATVISQTQIKLSWTDNSSDEIGFYIDRASDSGFGSNLVRSSVGPNVTSFSASGLSAASTYYFQVRAYNNGGSSDNSAPVSATTLRNPPTDIALSNASVAENQPAGTVVGTLSSTDEYAGNSFSYALVQGDGSTDNGSFVINGDQLVTATSFSYNDDYGANNSYSIRLRTTDAGGLSYEKVLTITVTNVNEMPTDIQLSNASVPESQPIRTVIGVLSAVSSDSGETFSYALVSGANSDDNSSFQINGDDLETAITFHYIPSRSYAIRVRATAPDGQWVEKAFALQVSVLPEFGLTGGKKAVSLSRTDADGDMVTFKLSGGGLGALWGDQLSLIGTTSKSVLTISVKRGKSGDGQYLVGGITSDGLMKGINARSVVLSGQVLLNSLDQPAGKASVSLSFLQVVDGGMQSQAEPIKSLSLLDWQDSNATAGLLLAPSIGSISVKGRKPSSKATGLGGDLDGDVSVSGGIKSIRVAGTLAGDVTVGTTIGSLKAGVITGTITQGEARSLSLDTSSVALLQDGGILVIPSSQLEL